MSEKNKGKESDSDEPWPDLEMNADQKTSNTLVNQSSGNNDNNNNGKSEKKEIDNNNENKAQKNTKNNANLNLNAKKSNDFKLVGFKITEKENENENQSERISWIPTLKTGSLLIGTKRLSLGDDHGIYLTDDDFDLPRISLEECNAVKRGGENHVAFYSDEKKISSALFISLLEKEKILLVEGSIHAKDILLQNESLNIWKESVMKDFENVKEELRNSYTKNIELEEKLSLLDKELKLLKIKNEYQDYLPLEKSDHLDDQWKMLSEKDDDGNNHLHIMYGKEIHQTFTEKNQYSVKKVQFKDNAAQENKLNQNPDSNPNQDSNRDSNRDESENQKDDLKKQDDTLPESINETIDESKTKDSPSEKIDQSFISNVTKQKEIVQQDKTTTESKNETNLVSQKSIESSPFIKTIEKPLEKPTEKSLRTISPRFESNGSGSDTSAKQDSPTMPKPERVKKPSNPNAASSSALIKKKKSYPPSPVSSQQSLVIGPSPAKITSKSTSANTTENK